MFATGSCELIKDVATPFVTLVVADLLRVPPEDRQFFMDCIDAAPAPGNLNANLNDFSAENHPMVVMGGYFAGYIADRRANPRDDILTELALATYPDGTLPDLVEIVKMATFLFGAGQAALPDMLEAKWGRIITISSHAAQSGAMDRAHYAAAKGGVIGLTRLLAREFAAQGITVNTIPPSVVDTPMAHEGIANGAFPPLDVISQHIPIPRAGTPEDIAFACESLASDNASYITGQELAVNGGMFIGCPSIPIYRIAEASFRRSKKARTASNNKIIGEIQ